MNRAELALVKNISHLTVSERRVSVTRKGKIKATDLHPKSLPNVSVKVGPTLSSFWDIAAQIGNRHYKNIVVMAGAGMSTSSEIPDFRTPGTELYDNLKQCDIPYPEAIFDIDYFIWNPKPFFLAKSLYPGNYKPNDIHYFLRLLHDQGLLLRLYTQNIDGLEQAAGIPSEKLVEAHGTFLTASCSLCNSSCASEKAKAAILNDEIPRCKTCLGIVKLDIVFFGESLPKNFFSYRKDFKRSDLLIVMGTSLEIEPFASIVNSVQPHVPHLLLN